MSSDAVGWTFSHSPYQGATFAVHVAIADSVNDQNGNEFWMSVANLATKARCERKTATKAVGRLVEDGYLKMLQERKGLTTRYRFEFPSVEVVYNSRSTQPGTSAPEAPQPGSVQPGSSGRANPGNPRPQPGSSRPTNPREPKEKQPKPSSAPPARKAPDLDPADAKLAEDARACAQYAFEQHPAPLLNFPAVQERCREVLRAGHSPDDLCRVISEGDVTWTRNALQFRLGKARGAGRNGTMSRDESLAMLREMAGGAT